MTIIPSALVCIDLTQNPSEGGCFKAHLYFPKEYPQRPPKMKFMSEMWHPNGNFSPIQVYNTMT